MNEYSLINSKAIREHCKKLGHRFNTEELAVLIYRNKTMSIDEKIGAYKELINDYPDMPVIERINCKHYDSVKDMIQKEIQRLKELRQEMQKESVNMIYTYEVFYIKSQRFEESNNLYKNYDEVCQAVFQELKLDMDNAILHDVLNEMLMIRIIKRSLDRNEKRIIEEYIVENDNNIKLININDTEEKLDINNIFLNIPTPFKKGDILVSFASNLYNFGTFFDNGKYVFVLDWLCTWEEESQKKDKQSWVGKGYMLFQNDKLECNYQYDYDNWEYFDGELQGVERILKAISSFIQGKINLDLLLETYKYVLADKEVKTTFRYSCTDEELELVGLPKSINIIDFEKESINWKLINGNILNIKTKHNKSSSDYNNR